MPHSGRVENGFSPHAYGYPISVVIKKQPPMEIVSIRSKAQSYAAISRIEKELLDSLPRSAMGDTRGTLWHRCSHSGWVEGEPFLTLRQRVSAEHIYKLGHLSAAILACAYCESDDDSSEKTYLALGKWMRTHGYRLAGPKRELSHDRLLEIQFPIEPVVR